MRKDPTEFRKRFAKWKEGGKPYKDGKISDELYVSIMENVAADNWLQWGDESEDAALTRILNDNAYDYRGYYNDNPGSAANADTHWPDEYKTVWHPTFSTQSKYSGKKSLYNPYGYPGGTWQGELFNPQWYQQYLGTGFYKDGYPKLPKFEIGTEGENSLEAGIYIGAMPFILAENERIVANNKPIDKKIASKSSYGWDGNSRSVFFNSPAWLKRNVNPAWNIVDANVIKIPFGTLNMSGATKDDNAFFQRHLGYPRDFDAMPITGIRFSGDYNKDGTRRLPNAEYTGLSKLAKDFIKAGIKNGKIKPNEDGSWTKIDEGSTRWGKYTSHLGTYSIRENNGSGIYDVYDTYDFPWYNPILNRKDGKQIEIRDTIHGENARPNYYNIRYSKKNK